MSERGEVALVSNVTVVAAVYIVSWCYNVTDLTHNLLLRTSDTSKPFQSKLAENGRQLGVEAILFGM